MSQTGPSAAPASARLPSHCAVGASSVSAGGLARSDVTRCGRGVCSDVVHCGRGACSACDACSAHTTRRNGRITALKSIACAVAAPGSLSNTTCSRKVSESSWRHCAKHLQRMSAGSETLRKASVVAAKKRQALKHKPQTAVVQSVFWRVVILSQGKGSVRGTREGLRALAVCKTLAARQVHLDRARPSRALPSHRCKINST